MNRHHPTHAVPTLAAASPGPGPGTGTAGPNPDILAFSRRVGLDPDPAQSAVLLSGANRGILNCSRQWGKSTLAAVLSVHRCLTRPDSLVLFASPSRRQSAELLLKARALLNRLGLRLRGDGVNPDSLVFPNNSRIVALPCNEATTRGFSAVSMLIVDEAARVPDEHYKALRPALAVGRGDVWLMSTPWGRRGFFYHSWAFGGSDWFRVESPATQNPRISPAFLEEERRNLGTWFEQEYLCHFMDRTDSIFASELVEAALDSDEDTFDFRPLQPKHAKPTQGVRPCTT